MNNTKAYALIVATLLLTACQTVPNEQSKASTNGNTQSTTAPTAVLSSSEVVRASDALNKLLQQATQQQRDGDLQAASATLERAIRIAPRYPNSYYRLAKIHYQQKNYAQAISLAQKALSLGASGRLEQQSLALIASASH